MSIFKQLGMDSSSLSKDDLALSDAGRIYEWFSLQGTKYGRKLDEIASKNGIPVVRTEAALKYLQSIGKVKRSKGDYIIDRQ